VPAGPTPGQTSQCRHTGRQQTGPRAKPRHLRGRCCHLLSSASFISRPVINRPSAAQRRRSFCLSLVTSTGEVSIGVRCLVSLQDYAERTQPIFTKFDGKATILTILHYCLEKCFFLYLRSILAVAMFSFCLSLRRKTENCCGGIL